MVTIHERVRAVRDRLQKQWTWLCLSRGMLLGGLLGCLLGVVRYSADGSLSWAWIGAAVLAGPIFGACLAMINARTLQSAAMMIDRHCKLKDRTETALRFLSSKEESPVRRLQIADTASHLQNVDPARVVPFKAPRSWLWGMSLTVAAVVIAFWTSPQDKAQATLIRNDVVFAQASRVEDGLEELRKAQEEQLDPELEKLLKEMAAKVEELKQPGLDPKEALANLSEMEAAMQEMQKQLTDPQSESQLQEIGKALALAESLASAGQAMSKGEMEKAAEELAKLDMPELDRKTEKAITEKLDQLQQNSGDGAKKQQLKEALGQVSQGLSQGDRSKFKDGTNGLASECKKQGQRKKLSDILRKQCQCLSECKGECESECKSQSESNKKGGTKAGLARSGNEPGDKTAKLKTGPQMNITGQESTQGDVDIETTSAPEQEQEAIRQYRENADKYEALSESVLESESIPLGHRQTIRRYFELIRPKNGETDAVLAKP
ncbi:MAG: hypothetical protein SGI77_07810 [Pirellulaceae bacterium]|nr:hypothetical protein [Pirellulaceae bacterium]